MIAKGSIATQYGSEQNDTLEALVERSRTISKLRESQQKIANDLRVSMYRNNLIYTEYKNRADNYRRTEHNLASAFSIFTKIFGKVGIGNSYSNYNDQQSAINNANSYKYDSVNQNNDDLKFMDFIDRRAYDDKQGQTKEMYY